MPLSPEVLGTNADGSKSEEYCIYCYKDGAFTGDFNMEQMVEFCSQFVDEFNKNTGKSLTREEYKVELRKYFPVKPLYVICEFLSISPSQSCTRYPIVKYAHVWG